MRLYYVQANVAGKWLDWVVLAISAEQAVQSSGAAEREGVMLTSIEAFPMAGQGWVLQGPKP